MLLSSSGADSGHSSHDQGQIVSVDSSGVRLDLSVLKSSVIAKVSVWPSSE
jgi:hypothetical protein